MLGAEGRNWIRRFRNQLVILYVVKTAFYSLAVGIAVAPFAKYMGMSPILLLLTASILFFVGAIVFNRGLNISLLNTSKYLNAQFPVLEESATLLLMLEDDLSVLEKFQVKKINALVPVASSLNEPIKRLWPSVFFLIAALLSSFVLTKYLPDLEHGSLPGSTPQTQIAIKENIPAEIKSFSVKISPPAYTNEPVRVQRQFAIKAELGAAVIWSIQTTSSVKTLRIIFNDREIINLSKRGLLKKIIKHAGFYQLEVDGKKSDFYPIEVIADLPVVIKISSPQLHTTIDIGQKPSVNLKVSLTDDYGIRDAYISATLSSGKGEGVSFTEKKLTFNTDFNNRKAAQLNKFLDLTALGLKPGDELYFYVEANDNQGQTSRSDVYLVSIVDPSELLSMAGMTNGVDLVPEYFRSQRQIIIDTEKLLKEQATITVEDFSNRSNALGMDQKLLRLRYGKFLGEESESGTGAHDEHEEGEAHTEPAYGDVKALMDEYAHKHDIAEDATFFEPDLKKQLKAVLNEMWSSELRLRTYKPQEAIPFEYKALRLLKDLQQKSRAYVAKTTIKTTKLKFEKRLTGPLDKITESSQQADIDKPDQTVNNLKTLLAVLEHRKSGKPFNYGDRELLRAGEKQLIAAAPKQPNSYLSALKSLRKLSSQNDISLSDINVVQKAIQQLIGTEPKQPQMSRSKSEANIYRSYFNHLQNGN